MQRRVPPRVYAMLRLRRGTGRELRGGVPASISEKSGGGGRIRGSAVAWGRSSFLCGPIVESLWNKKVACYGVPEYPPMPESARGPQPGSSGLVEFEVWVSEENLPLAKWILESVKEEFEKEPAEGAHLTVDEVSPETAGVCPLCFGEFTTASSHCPNCGVPLQIG